MVLKQVFAEEKVMKPQINLLRGWPAPSLLPSLLLAQGARSVLEEKPIIGSRTVQYDDLALHEKALLYGPDQGHLPLRKSMSRWLSDFYRPAVNSAFPNVDGENPISHERVIVTGGASQSLGIILNTLTDPSYTRNVWIVAPGYLMVFKIFEDAGFPYRLRSVPETKNGPDVGWLRSELQKCEKEWTDRKTLRGERDEPVFKPKPKYPKTYKHVIYTVPNFANPSGVTTSLDVREEMVRCAREFDALVICDDVYDMLQWSSKPVIADGGKDDFSTATLPRLVDVDRYLPNKSSDEYGHVVSNGSFSKICAPGVRCGWVEASEKLSFLISQDGATKSGGSPSQMTSTFIDKLITSGELTRHIQQTLRPAYRERWMSLMMAITKDLVPLGVTVAPSARPDVAGGYFVWLALPMALTGRIKAVVDNCLHEENLIVAGGNLFEVPGDGEGEFDNNLRLCFAWEAPKDLEEGVLRLGKVLRSMLADGHSGGSAVGTCQKIDDYV